MGRKLIIGVVLVAVVVAGALIARSQYNEKPVTASERTSDVTVDATALFRGFTKDEVAAGKLYNDKVVQVSGQVRSISSEPGGPVNVTLETGDPLGGVVCEFDPAQAPQWTKGANVKVKGICAGFNMDVLLQRCAPVE